MKTALIYLLYATTAVATITGMNVLLGGAEAVPGASGPVEASVDNELRFFAVYWMGFGALCFWVARHLGTQLAFVPFIALFFLLGGIGRLISVMTIGSPSVVLVSAMVLEFVLPLALYLLYRKLPKPQ